MSLAAGTKLEPYEIVSILGAGGMGEVYRARDPRLGRDVAIKVLPTAYSADADRLRRFELEARAAASLNHPNILAVFDIGTSSGAPYIVSELLEGQTLRDRLAGTAALRSEGRDAERPSSESSPSRLPIRKTIEYAIQMVRGLAAAHDKGIVHRDLKPENVFVTSDGRIKILDFGLAKLTETDAKLAGVSHLPTTPIGTHPGVLMGTLGYMAPEQVRGQPADHRADIFAFGAILYEMLSGARAFRGATAADTISAILDKDPPDLLAAERRVPPALQLVVERCLEKAPAARFQSTHDLAFALESVVSHSDQADAAPPVAISRVGARERVAWTVAALVAVGAVAAVIMARGRNAGGEVREVTNRFTIAAPPEVSVMAGPSTPISIAISPDGRQIVFAAASRADRTQVFLWLRPLDALQSRQLAGTEGALYPFWSPDSRFIGFFSLDGKLKKVDVSGGGPQTLTDVTLGVGGLGGTWSRDGIILFARSLNSGLFRVSAAGGESTPVTTLAADEETSHRWPSFLPDGQHFLYVALPDRTVYVGSLNSPERKKLVSPASKALFASGRLLFERPDTLFAQRFDLDRLELTDEAIPVAEQISMTSVGANAASGSAFSVSDDGQLVYRAGQFGAFTSQLTWFDRTGKPLGSLGGTNDYRGVALSPNEERLAAHPHDLSTGGDMWLFDLTRGTSSRFTFGGHTTGAIWSPDGTRVVYGSNRASPGTILQDPYSGTFNLYEKRADNSGEPTLLLDSTAAKHTISWKQPSSWSPDGQAIVYEAFSPRTTWDLWKLPLSGDRKPQPLLQSEFEEIEGQISPDGRWLAYTSDESKHWEVYVRPLEGSGKYQISTSGGRLPSWRGDTHELFYISSDRKMMGVEVGTKGTALDLGIPRPLFDVHIISAYFQPNPISPVALSPYPYSVTRNGQRFLIATDASLQTPEPPLTVVTNWPATLRR